MKNYKIKKNFPKWDYVILTASNEQQAEGFRRQLEERAEFLLKSTKFVAIPDRDRYIGNEPDSLFALNEIQKLAALMRFELERGNIDEFARLLDQHWELSKKVDSFR